MNAVSAVGAVGAGGDGTAHQVKHMIFVELFGVMFRASSSRAEPRKKTVACDRYMIRSDHRNTRLD